MRLVGSGLGRSLGSGCSFPSSHTRLPSLRKGKERVRDELGERSGVPEGDVNLGSAMSEATPRRMHLSFSRRAWGSAAGLGPMTTIWRSTVSLHVCQEETRCERREQGGASGRCGHRGGLIEANRMSKTSQRLWDLQWRMFLVGNQKQIMVLKY